MGIVVEQVFAETARGVRAQVRHEDSRFVAEVVGPPARIQAVLGTLLNAEFECSSVNSWRVLAREVREEHGLFATDSGFVRVVGQVSQVVEFEGGALIDLYVQAGPEFLCFDSGELGGTPPAGTPVEVMLAGLSCFPTWT